ncbi:MAG: DUF3426 domain-containing protein [Alphaproteobacteria bacterium]|nr:DUF3426 domain-containing protein [Alphaproteobacteria bacterium]
MIITCPECETRYGVDAAAIGASGRTVRCSRCSHSWVEYQPDNLPPPREVPTSSPRLDSGRRSRPAGTNLPALPRDKKSKAPAILWFLVILTLVGMIAAAIVKRDMIMERLPGSTTVFEALGLIPPPGAGLAIENQRIKAVQKGGKQVVRIEGDIVNVSGKAALVPTMLGIIRDKTGKVLKRWRFKPPLPKLLNKERIGFATEVLPPKGSETYIITFDQRN